MNIYIDINPRCMQCESSLFFCSRDGEKQIFEHPDTPLCVNSGKRCVVTPGIKIEDIKE